MVTPNLGRLTGVALMVAGCADDQVVAPTSGAPRASVAVAGRYVVGLNGSERDFAARVAELGGSIESMHEGAGVAVINGLSEAGAAELATTAGVSELVADVEIQANEPAAAILRDAQAITSQSNPASGILAAWAWNQRTIGADQAWTAGTLGSASVSGRDPRYRNRL